MITPLIMNNYLRCISAFNDPTRLLILKFLQRYGRSCVCELQYSFNMGQPRLSRHLKILKDAGILVRDREGSKAFYSIVPEDKLAAELLKTIDHVSVSLPEKIGMEEIKKLKEAA